MTIRAGMKNFLTTDLYGLTAEEFSAGRSNIEVSRLLIDAGITVLQYREKTKHSRDMYQECIHIRELTRQSGVTFIVNDHVALAMAVDADGVHIGQDDLPPAEVRRLIGETMVIGLSTHAPEQALAAQHSGVVDYIGVGPVFPTKTKKDVCDPVGLDYVDYVAKHITLPFVAIGGIKEHNIHEVRQHGARIAALVTELVGAPDIAAKVRAIRTAQ